MQLVDINVWLALVIQSHANHLAAMTWMRSASKRSCCFCRVTQMGFLRLVTNRKIYPLDAVPMNQAWQLYEQLLTDHRVIFVEEPMGIDIPWRNLTMLTTYSTNVWTDAYLAAFALTADLEMITFDKGFAQFTELRHTILT